MISLYFLSFHYKGRAVYLVHGEQVFFLKGLQSERLPDKTHWGIQKFGRALARQSTVPKCFFIRKCIHTELN